MGSHWTHRPHIYVFSESPFEMVTITFKFTTRPESPSSLLPGQSHLQVYCQSYLQVPPIWNCHWWQIKICLIYVFSESPFEMVTITFTFTAKVTFKFTARVTSSVPPHLKCHWWQMKYCLIYVFSESWFQPSPSPSSLLPKSPSSLLPHQSHLQVYCQSHLQVYPPFETVIDGRWGIAWSMCSVRAHSKLLKFTPQVYSSSSPVSLTPPPIEHRSMKYHYTKEVSHIQECTYTLARCTPTPIDHRCMEYHYTQ